MKTGPVFATIRKIPEGRNSGEEKVKLLWGTRRDDNRWRTSDRWGHRRRGSGVSVDDRPVKVNLRDVRGVWVV